MKPQLPIAILSILLVLMIFSFRMGPLWLTNVTEPLHATLNSTFANISNFGGWLTDVKKLTAERDSLASQRNQLLAQVAQLKAQVAQNQAWQRQLDASTVSPQQLIPAATAGLVNRGPSQYLLLGKGDKQGIKQGQIVVSDGVLVGKIKDVASNVSLVQLSISQDNVIPVMITSGQTTAKGVVEGQFNLSARLDQVLPTEKIETGDTIVTSGEAATYPPNLVVGTVGQLSQNKQIFQSAQVNLPWDIAKLTTVFVIKS